MEMQPVESSELEVKGLEGFLKYPVYKVVSIFDKPEDLEAAVADLNANGFSIDDIESFCGLEDAGPYNFQGTKPTLWESVVHAVKHIGPERTYLERYEKALAEGHCLLMVRVEKEERKQNAAEILHTHTSERVTYFGLTMADEIQEHSADEIVEKPTHW